MNKYQKEKSREIRDIMRSDGFGRMTYKEAKRKWRNGIRAFRIGDMYAWMAADIAHLGFSRGKLREVGQAYNKVLAYCGERNLGLMCYYVAVSDHYTLRFSGWSADGKKFAVMHAVSGDTIQHCKGSLLDITHRVLEEVNCRLQEFIFPSVVKTDLNAESLYPRMTLHPWDLRTPEAVFGKIIVKE